MRTIINAARPRSLSPLYVHSRASAREKRFRLTDESLISPRELYLTPSRQISKIILVRKCNQEYRARRAQKPPISSLYRRARLTLRPQNVTVTLLMVLLRRGTRDIFGQRAI